MSKSNSDPKVVLEKIQKYCLFQDRCQSEVAKKLASFPISVEDKEAIINQLIDDRFLDEERFTETFIRSKFNQNRWGKLKIKMALQAKGVGNRIIDKWIDSLDEEKYIDCINYLIQQKKRSIKSDNPLEVKHKVANYIIGKGFESELVWQQISHFFNNEFENYD